MEGRTTEQFPASQVTQDEPLLRMEDFYALEQARGREKQYVFVWAAYPEGARGEEHGLVAYDYLGRPLPEASVPALLSAQKAIDVTAAPFAVERVELPPCHRAYPVSKGQPVPMIQTPEMVAMAPAPHAGYVIDHPCLRTRDYLTSFAYDSIFNVTAGDRRGYQVLTARDEAPVTGIVLQDDRVFWTQRGLLQAFRGAFMFPNPAEREGFTVTAPAFTVFGLRARPEPELTSPARQLLTNAGG